MPAELLVWLQRLLPQHGLSRITGWAATRRWRWFKNTLIGVFVRLYPVNLAEALDPNPRSYESFNAFFTRKLAADARPLAEPAECAISPVDGTVSQLGQLADREVLQAKGHSYSVDALLGSTQHEFAGGSFATIYLAPHDYHRVHMPIAARLYRMTLIPGRLYSVGDATTSALPDLFALNERVVFDFDSDRYGRFSLVMVGAMNVGSVTTVHDGQVLPVASGSVSRRDYEQPIVFARGAELARFNLGSTVILLFRRGALSWEPTLETGSGLRMGQKIGSPAS